MCTSCSTVCFLLPELRRHPTRSKYFISQPCFKHVNNLLSVRVHGRLACGFAANLAAARSGVLTAVVCCSSAKDALVSEKPDIKLNLGDGSFTKATCPTWLEEAGQTQDLHRVCWDLQQTCLTTTHMLVPLSQEKTVSSPRTTIVQAPRPPFTKGSERLVEMREQRLKNAKFPTYCAG